MSVITIGTRIKYTGDMANMSGNGAVTDSNESRFGKSVTIILHDGREIKGVSTNHIVPPELERGCLHRYILSDGYAAPDEIAMLKSKAATRRAAESAKKEEAKSIFAAEMERLKIDHPTLKTTSNEERSSKTAAFNIRVLLKGAFPGIKFSVRDRKCTHSRAVDISWIDGPTAEQVEQITNRFQSGDFDGSDDCYKYARTPWSETFGDAEYVSCHRSCSETLIQRAIDSLVQEHGDNDVPTVEDFKMGRSMCKSPFINPGHRDDWQSLIHRWCAKTEN